MKKGLALLQKQQISQQPQIMGIVMGLLILLFPFLARASWQKIDRGLYYQKIELQKKSGVPYAIHTFQISPRYYQPKPILSEKPVSIRNLVEKSGAVLGVNANFFDPAGKPLGLIISDGKIVNPKKDISWWGVFSMEKGRPHIVHSSDWKKNSADMAVQAGPRLVVAGRVPALKDESSQKTALGINRKGDIILVVTYYPLSIKELAKLMALPESKGGLDCVYALNLDGGSSTQLYAKTNQFELKVPSFVGVPVGLGFFKK